MNIFFLHKDPKKAAEYHADKHTVKMVTEYFQLLSAAHKVLDGDVKKVKSNYPDPKTGKPKLIDAYVLANKKMDAALGKTPVRGHAQHPCAVWARKTSANYEWLYRLFIAVSLEYHARYGKHHNSYLRAKGHLGLAPKNIRQGKLTMPPQAMPEIRHIDGDFVEAYRNFYRMEKRYFVTWKTQRPSWYDKGMRPSAWYDKPHKHLYRVEYRRKRKGKRIVVLMLAPNRAAMKQVKELLARFEDTPHWGPITIGFLYSRVSRNIKDLIHDSQRNGQENNRLLTDMINEADLVLPMYDMAGSSIPKFNDRVRFVSELASSRF